MPDSPDCTAQLEQSLLPSHQLQSRELQGEPNLGAHPAQKLKAAFCAGLIPLLEQVSENPSTCCTKARFPGMRKEGEQTFCWGE